MDWSCIVVAKAREPEGDAGEPASERARSQAERVAEVLANHLRAGRKADVIARRVLAALADGEGPIEQQVRADIGGLGVLDGARGSYAEVAYRLARALDDGEELAPGLAGASRELREAMTLIWKGVRVEKPSDEVVADLGQPVVGRPGVPAAVRDPA